MYITRHNFCALHLNLHPFPTAPPQIILLLYGRTSTFSSRPRCCRSMPARCSRLRLGGRRGSCIGCPVDFTAGGDRGEVRCDYKDKREAGRKIGVKAIVGFEVEHRGIDGKKRYKRIRSAPIMLVLLAEIKTSSRRTCSGVTHWSLGRPLWRMDCCTAVLIRKARSYCSRSGRREMACREEETRSTNIERRQYTNRATRTTEPCERQRRSSISRGGLGSPFAHPHAPPSTDRPTSIPSIGDRQPGRRTRRRA
jgi:hypothetical protein